MTNVLLPVTSRFAPHLTALVQFIGEPTLNETLPEEE
jgi:hypothetical protein